MTHNVQCVESIAVFLTVWVKKCDNAFTFSLVQLAELIVYLVESCLSVSLCVLTTVALMVTGTHRPIGL